MIIKPKPKFVNDQQATNMTQLKYSLYVPRKYNSIDLSIFSAWFTTKLLLSCIVMILQTFCTEARLSRVNHDDCIIFFLGWRPKKKKIMAIWQIMENDTMYLDQTQEEGVERVTFFPLFFGRLKTCTITKNREEREQPHTYKLLCSF